jgi:hypothetical protein
MRILAFLFARSDVAQAVINRLRSEKSIDSASVATAPLSVDDVDGTIVALPVAFDTRDAVIAIAVAQGGRLIADIPEEWTTSRPIGS